MYMGIGIEVIYKQAPCQPDGVISRDGQEESKEGTCRCLANPEGCCVDSIGQIIPLQLKDKPQISVSELENKKALVK